MVAYNSINTTITRPQIHTLIHMREFAPYLSRSLFLKIMALRRLISVSKLPQWACIDTYIVLCFALPFPVYWTLKRTWYQKHSAGQLRMDDISWMLKMWLLQRSSKSHRWSDAFAPVVQAGMCVNFTWQSNWLVGIALNVLLFKVVNLLSHYLFYHLILHCCFIASGCGS